jgi:hypothetical protein
MTRRVLWSRCLKRLVCAGLAAGLLTLGGCTATLTQGAGAGAGIAAAGVSRAVTKNGAITAGIGLGAQAVAIAGVQALEKTVHNAEQNAIAGAAGNVPVGGVGSWAVDHDIPIENDEHGELTVVRDIMPALPSGTAPAFVCKEIIFSVDTMREKQVQRDFYTADVCLDGTRWKWATAEPATARWGALQ